MTIDAMFTQFPRLKFYLFDEGFHRAETGYELNRAFWRQGIIIPSNHRLICFAVYAVFPLIFNQQVAQPSSPLPQPIQDLAIGHWPTPEAAQPEELIGSMKLLIHERKAKIHCIGP